MCQTQNHPNCPNYCMNGFDLRYFYDFRNSTKIAVMFHLGNDAFTYYSAARDCLRGHLLVLEMMHPNSINDLCIETFSMIGKQMEIAVIESSGNDINQRRQ